MSKTVFSAMRPTGKLHLGHLVGALSTGWNCSGSIRVFFPSLIGMP